MLQPCIAKMNCYLCIQFKAHLAFCETQGMLSIALKSLFFCLGSLIKASRSKLYISISKWRSSNQTSKSTYYEPLTYVKRIKKLLRQGKKHADHTHIVRKLYPSEYFPLQFENHKMRVPAERRMICL